ncbi:hypothetical protein [Vitreimonas flagellata]|uniref:hypothetical protein n=1 Tax=Vitreimonas flagellata TaxID=2560861 RepID=UPI00107515E4|nr:hypothetical protein [Vitreimonas flagellata]
MAALLVQIRVLAAALAAVVAVAVPTAQALFGFGLSAGEFSYQGDATLRVAGYAFSIWGLLYIGMIAHAGYQVVLGPRSDTPPMLVWGSVLAMSGCGLWIIAAALNGVWWTLGILSVAAAALIFALARAGEAGSTPEQWLVRAPMSLLAGWLTIAAIVNAMTSLTIEGFIGAEHAQIAALAAIAVALVLASALALRLRNALYLLPIAWGLGGVYAAELARKTLVAQAAAAAALALLVVAVLVIVARRRQRQA